MKITGKEWKEFEESGWPEGYIWCDESTLDDGRDIYSEDGKCSIADNETFIVPDYWSISYEGPNGKQTDAGDGYVIRSLIRKWRKARDTEVLVITVPRDRVESIKAMLRESKVHVA